MNCDEMVRRSTKKGKQSNKTGKISSKPVLNTRARTVNSGEKLE